MNFARRRKELGIPEQTQCYTCGKEFDQVRYECHVCGEFQCSEKCRREHIETMDQI